MVAFDAALKGLVKDKVITPETALAKAIDPAVFKKTLDTMGVKVEMPAEA